MNVIISACARMTKKNLITMKWVELNLLVQKGIEKEIFTWISEPPLEQSFAPFQTKFNASEKLFLITSALWAEQADAGAFVAVKRPWM